MQLAGRILDQDSSQPIPFASITITRPDGSYTGVGVVSNINGQFYLDNPAADFPNYMTVSSTGYQSRKAQLYEDFYIYYSSDFLLQKSVTQLPPVVVTSGKKNNAWLLLLLIPLLAAKKQSVGKIKSGDVLTGGLIVAGVMGFGLIQKILDMLGLGSSPGTPDQQDPDSPWKPKYWVSHASQAKSSAMTNNFSLYWDAAGAIYNAFTLYSDNFDEIFAQLNKMPTKSDVSFLADRFQSRYNADMLSFLQTGGGMLPWDGLSSAHIKVLLNYVNNLPIT